MKRICSLLDGIINMRKVIVTISLAFVVLSIMAPSQLFGSPITEDDGYTYPDDATEEEKEEIDEQEQEAWEDAGRPGEMDDSDNDDDNGDGGEQIFRINCDWR